MFEYMPREPYGGAPYPRSPVPRATAPRSKVVLIVGIVWGLLGFVVSMTFSSTETAAGAVVNCSYTDFAAIVIGVAVIALGLIAAARAGRPGRGSGWELVLALGCVGLGAVHILRGLAILNLALHNYPC